MKGRLLLACFAPFWASAQSLHLSGADSVEISDGARVETEVTLSDPRLPMHTLPVAQEPAFFFLNYGTRGRGGPYPFVDGAAVGSSRNPYTLRIRDAGMRFTLQPSANTNAPVYGPFSATNGATVQIESALATVLRPAPDVRATINHPDRTQQPPVLAIAPYNVGLLQALYELRGKFAALANRVNEDTASVQFESVPRIHSGLTGNTFSPVVRTSARDKQNAYKSADLSAMAFLEPLLAQRFAIRSQAITDGATYHFRMAPGDYVFCAVQRIKDPNAGTFSGSRTAVWWTKFRFDGEHPLSLTLTAENAITWREVFPFDTAQ